MIAAHLGQSLAAEAAAAGTNYDWWQEFSAQACGPRHHVRALDRRLRRGARQPERARSTTPSSRRRSPARPPPGWCCGRSCPAASSIASPGDGRRGRTGSSPRAAIHFWRFLRVGAVAWLVLRLPLPVRARVDFHDSRRRADAATSRSSARRSRIALGGYLVFGLLLVLCNIVFDYARVRIVVEDRRSALGALLAGARFVRAPCRRGGWPLRAECRSIPPTREHLCG